MIITGMSILVLTRKRWTRRRERYKLLNIRIIGNNYLFQKRVRQFLVVLLLCFIFYPIVPTISYAINLWHLNSASAGGGGYNMKTARLEMFAR